MTDHPAALVSVPPHALEAIAFNLCSLHDFNSAFVQQNERFAKAVITEYLRAVPAPAAPQAAGVGEDDAVACAKLVKLRQGYSERSGELAAWIDKHIDEWNVLVRTFRSGLPALRAPSREPEGGAVDADAILEMAAKAVEDHQKAGREWVKGSLWDDLTREASGRIRALKSALATREEAPASCKSCNGSGMDAGSRFNRCPDCSEEAPAEAGGEL